MNDLKEISERIAKLAKKPPSAASRRQVMEALDSKSEGVQVVAARTLGAWGDKQSMKALTSLFEQTLLKSHHDGQVSTLIGIMSGLTDKLDREWLFDIYFDRAKSREEYQTYIRNFILVFPIKATAAALHARYRRGQNKDRIPGLLELMQFHALTYRRKD